MINFVKHEIIAPLGSDDPAAVHTIDLYVDGQSVQIVLPFQSTPEEVSAILMDAAVAL